MRKVPLVQMEVVLAAQYALRQKNFQLLVARETKIRQEIERLREYLLEHQINSQDRSEMRLVGADIAWQSWVGRKKTALNLELAQVLAIKEHHVSQLRIAYGKLLAARDLLGTQQRNLKKSQEKSMLSEAIGFSIMDRSG